MSQREESLQSRISLAVSCSVLEEKTECVINNVPLKAHADVSSTSEIPAIADASSASESLLPASISYVPESTLESPLAHGSVTETHSLDSGVHGNSVSVQDINTLLNSKDARVMYISPDVFVFDHPGLSSDTAENMPIILDTGSSSMASTSESDATLNTNYLVVVENIDGSQMLSTTMHRNVVLGPGNDIPISSIAPQTHISFSTTGNEDEGFKLRDVTDYTQPTITMVLDSTSSHLNSKGILVEPSSFITYSDHTAVTTDQLTFHAVHPSNDKISSSTAHLYESSEGSFIDISSLNVVTSDTPSSTTLHHTSTTQAALYSAQMTQPAVIQNKHRPFKHSIQQSLVQPAQETSVTAAFIDDSLTDLRDNCTKQNDGIELEQVKKERMKQELRFLEQCHLEHHLKQVQKKYFGKTKLENDTEECEFETTLDHNAVLLSDVQTRLTEKMDVDDETPIFSTVTATLNSTILTHITGCQQYLLDKAQENSSFGFDIEFTSDKDCTFNGTLKSLVILHNILKNLIQLKSRTLLEFRMDKSKQSSLDKAVMCDLLKPYISLRGRQPKCSLKAAEMGFVNDIDMYLQADVKQDIVDTEDVKPAGAEESSLKYKRKRKRGRSSKYIKNKVQKIKDKYAARVSDVSNMDNNVCNSNINTCHESSDIEGVGVSEIVEESFAEQETNKDVVTIAEADLTDTVQQCLLEEQLKYRKIVNQKQVASVFDVSDTGVSPDLVTLSNPSEGDDPQNNNGACTDTFEVPQENTSTSEIPLIGRPKRGRPRQAYNHLCMREKVHPRNPLTESAATKQQRNYEEQMSFKFFCHHCSFKTKRHSHFVSHMRCHKDGTEKKYMCKQCDFVTISVPMLKRHELKHSKSLFKCGICAAYTTDRQELLRRHLRMKHNVEQRELLKGKLSCDRCQFSCLSSEEFEKHKSVHDRLNQVADGDILNCAECKKAFRSRMHLQRHIRDVHGPEVRPHLCDKCGKAFKRTDALQQHKLVHISRTARSFPFKCTSCDKGFRSPAHLKEHMAMHSSERPFLCQYCGAAFKTQPVQKKHILTLHIRPRAHVCSVCCHQFNTKHALQRHENTHTKSDSVTEAAVLVIERENAMAEKEATEREKNTTLNDAENQSASLSVSESAAVEGQMSNCLVHDMTGPVVEEPLEQPGQTLQQAYIQGAQDGTLYYFTGELPTL